MPCKCDHMEPTKREKESVKVMRFLYEVGLFKTPPGFYGDIKNLDHHTSVLCTWCKKNDVKNYSLELQIWWRDHQKLDLLRESKERKNRLLNK